MKSNYHTHTTRCLHAAGSDEMYVQSAIKAGFHTLGFADHTPWPYKSDYVSTIRMGIQALPGYVASLKTLRETYKDQLNVLIGLECEYFPRYISWLKEARDAYCLDYLIFGAHFISSDEDNPYVGSACRDNAVMYGYADMCVEGMQSGLYVYLAHPDLYMRTRDTWDVDSQAVALEICNCALQYGIPLEYNLNAHVLERDGYRFPRREFWEVAAKIGNQVIIGYDAHQPELLEHSKAEGEIRSLLGSMGITPLDSLRLPVIKPQLCGQIQGGAI